MGVDRVVGRCILKGGVSDLSTGSDCEGVSDPWYCSSSESREIGSSSSSSSELPDSLMDSSVFLFVRSSFLFCSSWLTNPDVDRLPRMFVPVPVVGVIKFPCPAPAQDLREAISSVLISGIASCNRLSNRRSYKGRTRGGSWDCTWSNAWGSCRFRLGSGWVEERVQLLQRLLQLDAVIHHTTHHLRPRFGRRLLQTVVIQSRLVENIIQKS